VSTYFPGLFFSGTSNPHKFAVATQDVALREHLRQIPGVPILYVKLNQIILEPVSEATRNKVAQVPHSPLSPCVPALTLPC